MRALDIALAAHERAVLAADMEAAYEEALKMDHERSKRIACQKAFEAALPILRDWFGPDVQWVWEQDGDYLYDCIIREEAPGDALLKLKAERTLLDMSGPEAGYRMRLYVGDYVHDSRGYRYFSGAEVKSLADVGRYLKNLLVERYGS